MKTYNLLVSFVALAVLVLSASTLASAVPFAQITSIEVNGIEGFENGGDTAAVFAGETIDVRVIFESLEHESDVRVVARLLGQGSFSEVSRRFAVVDTNDSNNLYSANLRVRIPSDVDQHERIFLEVRIESDNGGLADEQQIRLEVQRESYLVEVLSVEGSDQIRAGETAVFDVVLKNRGYELAEDTYLRASIPELGISTTVYFGDLSAEDQNDPSEKEDAELRRVYLRIPNTASAGVYNMELEAYNSDSSIVSTKRVVVTGASQESRIVSSGTSKMFAVGEEKAYSITIVNAGNEIRVYDLAIDAPAELSVEAEDSIVVVPAGSSKTVRLNARASEEGTHSFTVSISSDGELVKTETYSAEVEGKTAQVNPSVVLTVVLAVIFVVLVVVLIVLLTRKPQKSEEFGESYY